MRYAICFCLYLGFACLFTYFCLGNRLEQFYRKTKNTLKKSNRETILMMRRALLQSQDKNPFWFQVEKCVYYTGLKRRFPFLSGMHLVLGGIVATALLLLLLMPFGFVAALLGCSVFGVATFGVLFFLRKREWKQTGQSLMSFLDFLGNYSVTAGEITWIFEQIAPYMKAPVKAALEDCVVEAKMTGDVNMALIAMADRVEHTQFREIIRNLEIGIRYLADFKSLVNTCKRSLRDYEKALREQKSMAMEGMVNFSLLLGMCLLSFFVVNGLIERSVWEILFFTWIGRGTLVFIAGIILAFFLQVGMLEK